MPRIAALYFALLLANPLRSQTNALNECLARIEENTKDLKQTLLRTDEKNDALQKLLQDLQNRVTAVDSQNHIILSISVTAFTIGLGFLAWLWKKLEGITPRQDFTAQDRMLLTKVSEKLDAATHQDFTEQDRILLAKIYERLSTRSSAAGASGSNT